MVTCPLSPWAPSSSAGIGAASTSDFTGGFGEYGTKTFGSLWACEVMMARAKARVVAARNERNMESGSKGIGALVYERSVVRRVVRAAAWTSAATDSFNSAIDNAKTAPVVM